MEEKNVKMPYKYVVKAPENGGTNTVRISTEYFTANWKEVEKFFITPEGETPAKSLTYYPNGFAYYAEVELERITFRTSHPIVQNDDGTFSVENLDDFE